MSKHLTSIIAYFYKEIESINFQWCYICVDKSYSMSNTIADLFSFKNKDNCLPFCIFKMLNVLFKKTKQGNTVESADNY